MVSAIKQISIANGHDPRDFVLLPYGGAGPMHAAAIADELEINRILVPVGPGNFAAFGSLISDIRRDYARTRTHAARRGCLAAGSQPTFAAHGSSRRARICMRKASRSGISSCAALLGMRYLGQSWELPVDLPPGRCLERGVTAGLRRGARQALRSSQRRRRRDRELSGSRRSAGSPSPTCRGSTAAASGWQTLGSARAMSISATASGRRRCSLAKRSCSARPSPGLPSSRKAARRPSCRPAGPRASSAMAS